METEPGFRQPFATLPHETQFRVLLKFAWLHSPGAGTPMHFFHVRNRVGLFVDAKSRLEAYILGRRDAWDQALAYSRKTRPNEVLEQAYEVVQAARALEGKVVSAEEAFLRAQAAA